MAAYTEVEWNLTLQAPATGSEVYEFRVYDGTTPFGAYLVTPQVTVAAPVDIVVAIPPATLQLGARVPAAGGSGDVNPAIPTILLRLTPRPLQLLVSGTATATPPPATLLITARAVQVGRMEAIVTCRITGPSLRRRVDGPEIEGIEVSGPSSEPLGTTTGPSLSRIPEGPARIVRQPSGPDVEPFVAAGPELSRVLAGPATVMEVVFGVGVLEALATGPATRRHVDGPAIEAWEVSGPSNEPVETTAGPSLSRTPTGPALITRMTDGPGIEVLSVDGPDPSRDVTGPAVEEKQLVLTGPGVCDGN